MVETHKIADDIITEPNLDFVKELIKTTRQLKCRKRAVNNNSKVSVNCELYVSYQYGRWGLRRSGGSKWTLS